MAKYHVNLQGEVGQCKATIACRFGEVSEHYESEIEARTAYEASMKGEEVRAYRRRLVDEQHAKEDRREDKASRRIEPSTIVPTYDLEKVRAQAYDDAYTVDPRTEPFYLNQKAGGLAGRQVTGYLDGHEVESVEEVGRSKIRVHLKDGNVRELIRNINLVDQVTNADLRVSETDKDAVQRAEQAARYAADAAVEEAKSAIMVAEQERTIEDHTLNDLPRHRSMIRDELRAMAADLNWSTSGGNAPEISPVASLSTALRVYRSKVEDFKRNGQSHPYSRALEAVKSMKGPYGYGYGTDQLDGHQEAAKLIEGMVSKPDSYEATEWQRTALQHFDPDHQILERPARRSSFW